MPRSTPRAQRRQAARAAPKQAPTPSAPRLRELAQASPARVALALAAVHLLLAYLAFNPTPHAGGDNAAYLSLGRALAQGYGYVELWDPARPPHTMYPPVWPGIVAAMWLVGLRGFVAMKAAEVVFSVIAVTLSYLWLRRTTTPSIALAAGLVLAVAPGVLELSHWELSDVPAWAFTALAFWASTHLVGTVEAERDADERRHGLWLGWMTAGLVLANFTRSAGLPLVVTALAWLAWRRRWKDAAVLAAAFFPFAFAWWLWGRTHGAPGYVSYVWAVDPYVPARGTVGLGGLVKRVLVNVGRYAGTHVPVVLTWRAWKLVGIPFLLLAIAGWARRLRRPGLAELWTVPYVALLLLWPSTWSGERFLLPLLPPLLCYAFEAVRDGAAALAKRQAWVAAAAVPTAAAVLLAALLPGLGALVRLGRQCEAAYHEGDHYPCLNDAFHDYFALADSTRDRLPPGSAVLARKASIFYALSGYPARTYPLSADPDTFFAAARRAGARYVVVDQIQDLAPLYLHPVLLARRDDFCVVNGLTLPNAVIMRIDPNGPRRPGAAANSFRRCGVLPDPAAPPAK